MHTFRHACLLLVAVSTIALAPAHAEERITKIPMGRALFVPPNQIYVAVTVGAMGVPLPGVTVSVSRVGDPPGIPAVSAVTDEGGLVSFRALEPGQYLVAAKSRNFLDTVVGPVPVAAPAPDVPLLPVLQVALNPAKGPLPGATRGSSQ